MSEDHYSADGPICPHCNHMHRPDEPFFYDEDNTEMDCVHCGKPFRMKVISTTAWSTRTCEEEGPAGAHP